MNLARKAASDLVFGLALLALIPCAAAAMPGAAAAVIGKLGLTGARYAPDPKGPDLYGALPGGVAVAIDFHPDDSLEEIESEGPTGFPAAEIAPALPAALLASPDWPKDALLWSVEFKDRRIEVEGEDPEGREFKAEFTAGGRLLEMKLED